MEKKVKILIDLQNFELQAHQILTSSRVEIEVQNFSKILRIEIKNGNSNSAGIRA